MNHTARAFGYGFFSPKEIIWKDHSDRLFLSALFQLPVRKPRFFSQRRQKILDKGRFGNHNVNQAETKGFKNKEMWSQGNPKKAKEVK